MRLYTKTGASQVDDPEFGSFKADANGAFDGLPDAMYAKLHGRPGWENDQERELRMASEELERFRDPASLLAAVKELSANQGVLATALAQALGLAPAAPAAVVPQPPAPAAPAVAPPSPPAPVVEPEVPAPTVKSAEASAEEPVEASPKVEKAEDAAVDVEPEAKEAAAPAPTAVAPAETAVKPASAVKATRARKSAASSSAPSA
jgi:hypothetical protein